MRLVVQPFRHAPERQVDGVVLLAVAQRRKGAGLREGFAVAVVHAEVEGVVRHHAQHDALTEHPGLAEHAPQGDRADRGQLFFQELGKGSARDHP